MKLILSFASLVIIATGVSSTCTPRDFGSTSFVCVCNADVCDYIPGPASAFSDGQFRATKSSIDQYRLDEEVLELVDNNVVTADVDIVLDTSVQYQSMIGFGGAFTDSTGINIFSLSKPAQDNIMRSYFGPDGLDYNIARIPIAGSDFSTRPYSYDDVEGDIELVNFALVEEDYLYKLPYIKQALNLTTKELYMFGSPWSPPSWMKTNGMFNESGELLPEMWQPWSDYFVKFVEAYEADLGISLWGLTTQNEPLTTDDWGWNSLYWSAENQRDWIKANLGPTLTAAGMRRLKLMVDDYNRDTLPEYPYTMTSDPNCSQYIDGVAVHWYSDREIGPEVLDQTHDNSPDKFILYTEACEGFSVASPEDSVDLGSWIRGEEYITNIIEDCNHWSTGWTDWNMALDMGGGPNWSENWIDSPIIVNAEADEFYFQPTHAALGHFSRYVQRDSLRINITNSDTTDNFRATAFLNPDSSVVVVLANIGETSVNYGISDENGQVITRTLDARSWETIAY